ncbi:MAG: hypothetical protein ABI551_23380 [Polyangiaceae bacterium]
MRVLSCWFIGTMAVAFGLVACGSDDASTSGGDAGDDAAVQLDSGIDGSVDASRDGSIDSGKATDAGSDACPGNQLCFDGHLYVANFNNGSNGFVGVYDGPAVDSDASATTTLGADAGIFAPDDVAYDPVSNNVAVVDFEGKVLLFASPLTASSVPSVTLKTGQASVAAAFDSSGRLYVSQFNGMLTMFPPPFSNGNAGNVTIVVAGFGNLFGAAIDPATQNLFIDGVAPGGTPGIALFATPLTGSSVPIASFGETGGSYFAGAVVQPSTGKLYASHTQAGVIEVYDPPFADGGAPASTFNGGGGASPWHLRFAASGELLIPDHALGILVVNPASPTVARVALAHGVEDVRGVTVAP